jgi:hypothetical protein
LPAGRVMRPVRRGGGNESSSFSRSCSNNGKEQGAIRTEQDDKAISLDFDR